MACMQARSCDTVTYCTVQHNPQEKIFKMTHGDPKVHFLDQFFMLIPNLVSDSPTDQVQYMNFRLKVELLCFFLDPTGSRIYENSLCKVRSRTTVRATPLWAGGVHSPCGTSARARQLETELRPEWVAVELRSWQGARMFPGPECERNRRWSEVRWRVEHYIQRSKKLNLSPWCIHAI